MTEGRDASAQQARMRPPEAQFDRELELVLGPGAAAHEQQTYLSFLGQVCALSPAGMRQRDGKSGPPCQDGS